MKSNRYNNLYHKCRNKNIHPNHVCEVGVYFPENSNVIDFIRDDIRTSLVEPSPKCFILLEEYFAAYKNVRIFPYAVYDYNGTLELCESEASTFVSDLKESPALINDKFDKMKHLKIQVECRIFSDIDDGSIDLLSVDTEGCEWFVLKNMRSRPLVISLETHGKLYINPFMIELNRWMDEFGYEPWFIDGSDTVYLKRKAFKVNNYERFCYSIAKFKIRLRRIRRKLILKLKG
ncbi:MAG: FkbM family methyltransferase [Ignavibacteria bacterium]|nr:FkbM family methyltransferase [Ignavibacteria bacterium]